MATRRIAIVLYDRFRLLGAGIVAEMFHTANELAAARADSGRPYEVRFVSASGGSVTSSSSARMWTDGIDDDEGGCIDLLFVAGGLGAQAAARDEHLLDWLRAVRPRTRAIEPIAEGRLVLDAAGLGGFGDFLPAHGAGGAEEGRAPPVATAGGTESLTPALMRIKRDLGADVARGVADRVVPGMATTLLSGLSDCGAASVSEKIHAAARWMESNCDRAVSIADAAQIAAMSERNFLRRFKEEMGVTQSDYLLQVRLRIACNYLTETELPVDKIARRCGTGNGDRLAKIFRKRCGLSPTEYRSRHREFAPM